MKLHLLLLFIPLMWCACKSRTTPASPMNAAFEREKSASGGESDLEDIRRSGELIVATISGPETYYDYRGPAWVYSMRWLMISHVPKDLR